MQYYVLVRDDIITLFSHTENRSCESIKMIVKEMSDNGFKDSIFEMVLEKMLEEGFKLISEVDVINVDVDNEQKQRGE